jgi:NADH:ubiquinone oxidoreductase subunit 6 (subunit J)
MTIINKIFLTFLVFCFLFFVLSPGITNAANEKNPLSAALRAITTLLFIAFFTLLAAITLLAIAIMLIVRYVYLTILLILSPIVWLLWIFPGTSTQWKKWWSQFLRWTFFAPLMLFFLYLTITVISAYPQEFVIKFTENRNLENQGFALDVAYVGHLVAILGLLLGGLFAANSLGITFAGTAYGWAQSVGKGFGGWVGRKGIQYGTGWARYKGAKEGAKSLAERTQEWAAGRKTVVGRWSAGWISRGTAQLAAVGGEDLVKRAKEQIKGKGSLEKKSMLPSASAPLEIAILEDLAASKDLETEDMKRHLSLKEKSLFARFGRGKGFNDMEKTVGKNAEMMEAALKKDTTALKEATDKFVKSLKMEDLKKGQWNDVYAEKPAFGLDKETAGLLASEISAAFAEHMPGAFTKITPKIKGKNFDNYQTIVRDKIKILKEEEERAGIPEEERKSKKAEDSFEKSLGWHRLGLTTEEMAKPEGT